MGKFTIVLCKFVGEGQGRAGERFVHSILEAYHVEKEFYKAPIGVIRAAFAQLDGVTYDPHKDDLADIIANEKRVSKLIWNDDDDDDDAMVGRGVRRYCGSFGWVSGTVTSVDNGLYRIRYPTREDEVVSLQTLYRILV